MQLTSLVLTILATSSLASAHPAPTPGDNTISQRSDGKLRKCLCDDQAAEIVATFSQALQINGNDSVTFNALLDSIANPDDAEYSDSLNFFIGLPEGSVSESNRTVTESGHVFQALGYYEVETLNIWHSCNVITWRYRVIIYPGAAPVQSILVLVLGPNGKIDSTYYEFNSAVWAQDMGYTITPPANGTM